MISTKKVANAVGGKTARACDSCIKKRARWYCAADDAFLCQACDASVHSANPLARRHERVRLKTASLKHPGSRHPEDSFAPSWHHGFTRKARTPRHGSKDSIIKNRQMGKPQESRRNPPVPLVPEVGNSDETSHEENEEDQLLYRVPIFDPFVAELCTSATSNEAAVSTVATDTETGDVAGSGSKALPPRYGQDVDSLHGFLPSDMDLAEFAADVETMLGRGLENGSFGMEELGLVDCRDKEMRDCSLEGGKISSEVKIEEEDTREAGSECKVEAEIEMTREPFEFSFDYDSHANWEEEDEKVVKGEVDMKDSTSACEEEDGTRKKKRKLLLRLDYEAVISAWTSHQSPWTTGDRLDFNPDECWPDCLSSSGTEVHHPYAEMAGIGMYPTLVDVGREARVSRYREKRRTRLFSKKIRYEVRKLNAEKRPRMKGRFVKRASFAAPAFTLLTSK